MATIYLAHSSLDKAYVSRVADRLGRARVTYAPLSFEPGIDFRDSIRNNLDKSKVFVFFVSRQSLRSTWVKYEIKEAEWRIIKGKISGALAIIIDEYVTTSDLPDWMQQSLVPSIPFPAGAARAIQNYLIRESGLEEDTIFVGREADLAQFSAHLIPDIDREPPRILIIGGLEGIGRRTFARHAIKNYLSLNTGPTFVLDEADSGENLHLQLLNETMELTGRAEFAETIKMFRSLSDEYQGKELARLVHVINHQNVVPIIVDKGPQGTFFDDHNWYKDKWISLLRELKEYKESYLVLIQPRLPDLRQLDQIGSAVPRIGYWRLDPLSLNATELLLLESFHKKNIDVTSEQIRKLATCINGYPPAAHFAIAYIERYGVDILLNDEGILNDFLWRRFDPLIKRLKLGKEESDILRILASLDILPLNVIATLIEVDEVKTAGLMRNLIEYGLIIPVESDFTISAPVRAAVSHSIGLLNKRDYSKISSLLKDKYWKNPDIIPALSIVDATIRSFAYCDVGDLNQFRDIVMPSQLYKVAKQKYDSRDWAGAEEIAKRALQLDSELHPARATLFRSLVRQRKWREAEETLLEIEKRKRLEWYYLKGFLLWKRGNLKQAIPFFKSGWSAGDESISVLRDLAHCLFHIGEIGEAKRYIGIALDRFKRNTYIIDLAAQIAIASEDDKAAVDLIDQLKEIDETGYHHRMASYLKQRVGNLRGALNEAECACNVNSPRFEALAQKADIIVELDLPEALKEIDKLEPYDLDKQDVKVGLKCKYYIKQNQWRRAETCWNDIRQKDSPIHKSLYYDILRMKSADPLLGLIERSKILQELGTISVQINLPLALDAEDID